MFFPRWFGGYVYPPQVSACLVELSACKQTKRNRQPYTCTVCIITRSSCLRLITIFLPHRASLLHWVQVFENFQVSAEKCCDKKRNRKMKTFDLLPKTIVYPFSTKDADSSSRKCFHRRDDLLFSILPRKTTFISCKASSAVTPSDGHIFKAAKAAVSTFFVLGQTIASAETHELLNGVRKVG